MDRGRRTDDDGRLRRGTGESRRDRSQDGALGRAPDRSRDRGLGGAPDRPRDRGAPDRRATRRAARSFAVTALAAAVWGPAFAPRAAAQLEVLREALPQIDGTATCSGLTAPVTVERDALGAPRVTATTRLDAARGLGYIHAQDRFLQMDVARRYAAGRLAALVGEGALSMDETMRVHRFDAVADGVVDRLRPEHRAILVAYAEGVNAGLASLDGKPFFHRQLGVAAAPWSIRDTVLVQLGMFDALHSPGSERSRAAAHATLPPTLYDLFTIPHSRFDSPVIVDAVADAAAIPPLPGPDLVDLRRRRTASSGAPAADAAAPRAEPHTAPHAGTHTAPHTDGFSADRFPTGDSPDDVAPIGSNNWAIAGTHTTDGRAILASDPHLMLTVPAIWYRAELAWPGRTATGATLPGSPGVVIGSNGRVAWGLTNTTADFIDAVVLEFHPDDASRYRVPGRGPDGGPAWADLIVHQEVIEIAGAESVTIRVPWTIWGPLDGNDGLGRPVAKRWVAYDPERVGVELLDFMEADSVEALLDMAAAWRGPSQNVVAVDDAGHIGWTISGALLDRDGFDGRHPVAWHDPAIGGWRDLPEASRPRVIDPECGYIHTANNRTVPQPLARTLGHQWANPVRAHRIQELLDGATGLTESAVHRMQLDTALPGAAVYAMHAAAALRDAPPDSAGAAIRDALAEWDGRAEPDARVVELLQRFRFQLMRRVVDPMIAAIVPGDERRRALAGLSREEPVLRILDQRPAHLVPPAADDWDAVIADALDAAIASFGADGPLARPWGEANRLDMRHPVSDFVPQFATFLDMPASPQSGHWSAVKVATPSFGQSLRLVVSPGREDDAVLLTPGGLSGHPGSRFYRSTHQAWLNGTEAPLRPGRPRTTLRLDPAPARPPSR